MTQARVVARVRSRRRTDHASPLPISSSANTSNKQTLSSDRESKPDKNSIYISQKTSNCKSNDAPFHTASPTKIMTVFAVLSFGMASSLGKPRRSHNIFA